MDDIISFAGERWPEVTLVIILIKLFAGQLGFLVPQAIKDYFATRAQLKADEQEHRQELLRGQAKVQHLKEMSEMSSSRFIEDQLTTIAAETQVQLVEANDFIRSLVSQKLDIIIEKQTMILAELRKLNGEKNNGVGINNINDD